MARRLLFIINPRSGKRNSEAIIELIRKNVPKGISYDIGLWTNIDEFNAVAQRIKPEGFTEVIAVGGDGSVNLVARTLLNTEIPMGIIPSGSGNGLARSLGIPMNTEKAIRQVIAAHTAVIDSGTVNGTPFFCTTGIGFDAHIGSLFASLPKRGLKAYVKLIAKEFFSYRVKDYVLSINGQEHRRKAFLITVANAGQYGNDFYIAPEARLTDGIFHIAVFKPFSLLHLPGILFKFMRRQAHRSRFIETFTCTELSIAREGQEAIHYDGEPGLQGTLLSYRLFPRSLKVIVGDGFEESK